MFIVQVTTLLPHQVYCDSNLVWSAFGLEETLNQAGRPVAFFSCTLQDPEVCHASVEKEAQAIIETVRHWKHYITGKHFLLKTDQRSVAYMFDAKQRG